MPAARKKKSEEPVTRETFDGRTVILSAKEAEQLAGKAICIGGKSFGCHQGTAHTWRVPRTVWVYNAVGGNRRHDLTEAESTALYRCRKCGAYMGCQGCAHIPQELFCLSCKNHANDLGSARQEKLLT